MKAADNTFARSSSRSILRSSLAAIVDRSEVTQAHLSPIHPSRKGPISRYLVAFSCSRTFPSEFFNVLPWVVDFRAFLSRALLVVVVVVILVSIVLMGRLAASWGNASGVRFTSVVAGSDDIVIPRVFAAGDDLVYVPHLGHQGMLFSPALFRPV